MLVVDSEEEKTLLRQLVSFKVERWKRQLEELSLKIDAKYTDYYKELKSQIQLCDGILERL